MKLLSVLIIMATLTLPFTNAFDKPSWDIGNAWDYRGNMTYSVSMKDETMNLSIEGEVTISINVRINVNGTVLKIVNNKPSVFYLLNIESYIDGGGLVTFKIPYENNLYTLFANLDINVTANGETYLTTKEIAVFESGLMTNAAIDVVIDAPGVPDIVLQAFGLKNNTIRAKNETKTTYMPPLDFLNFPINAGEEWWANCTTKYTVGDEEEEIPVELKFKCIDAGRNTATILSDYIPFIGEITIDVMGYPVPIMNFENTTLQWNSDKGMIEKMVNRDRIDENGIKISSDLDISLKDFIYTPHIGTPGTVNIICQNSSNVGENISFKAEANDEDGIIYYYWEFGDGTTSNKTNPTHTYKKAGKYFVNLTIIDRYGEETSATRTIEIKGESKTPGFEFLFILIAIFIAIKKRF